MDRRSFICHTAIAAGAATLPASLFAQTAPTIFRWVPASDLSILDPSYTTAAITATHALMVFDTLYGLDAQYQPQPQMIDSEQVDQDGLRWTLQLREGLMFHDGSPVRAQDAVASIKRFGARNLIGQTLFSCLDTLSATSDRSLEFKLTRPFSLLSVTLASAAASIMPERLANTPDNIAIKEVIGSGPFRFLPQRWVSGSQVA
jgi:peptide/nickel transport system substrate-binding protein